MKEFGDPSAGYGLILCTDKECRKNKYARPRSAKGAVEIAKKHEINQKNAGHEAVVVYYDSDSLLTPEIAGKIWSLTGVHLNESTIKFED